MKITMLSVSDWAGSGQKLCDAISRHTKHDIKLIAQKGNVFGHKRGELLTRHNRKRIQKRVNTSDIIHLKGDWPPSDVYIGLHIRNKKKIITTSGGLFRKKAHGGQGRFECQMHYYKKALCTSFEPDLLYKDFGNVWIPHPIDSMDKENIWTQPEIPIICHSPSDRKAKDTEFLLKVLDKLKIKFEFDLIEKVPFNEAVQRRKRATIFADAFKQGFYANSTCEAIQFGIPCVSWISPLSFKQGPEMLKQCPILTTNKTIEGFAKLLTKVLTNDMQELSNRKKKWCDEVHSFEAVAKQVSKIYESLHNI